jgi:uncharacterized iron-regulated membrane protein
VKLQLLNRKVHYWLAAIVALPILVIISTGLLLQLKKQVAWVQPPERKGAGSEPTISLPDVLEICRRVPEAGVATWDDVSRIDVRPSRGMLKVTATNSWEVQIDTRTGDVLQVAYRRSDLIEAIHDGSWFHPEAKLWVFLPAGAGLGALWLTGVYLFLLPYLARARNRRRREALRAGGAGGR